jgi:DNA-binding NtrC family response regulator
VLAQQFLEDQAGTKQPKRLDDDALKLLLAYEWPGNVRELENVIQRAAILSDSEVISVDHLAIPHRGRKLPKTRARVRSKKTQAGAAISPAGRQKAHVKTVLESVKWNKKRAAKLLGISVKGLVGKIKSYRLRKPK